MKSKENEEMLIYQNIYDIVKKSRGITSDEILIILESVYEERREITYSDYVHNFFKQSKESKKKEIENFIRKNLSIKLFETKYYYEFFKYNEIEFDIKKFMNIYKNHYEMLIENFSNNYKKINFGNLDFVKKMEFYSSVAIEGTKTIFPNYLKNNYENECDEIEINNIENTYKWTIKAILEEKREMNHHFLREIHQSLFFNLTNCGYKFAGNVVGDYKKEENFISIGFSPASPMQIKDLLEKRIFNIFNKDNHLKNDDDFFELLINAAFLHAEFERIHPFTDGNGRIGRFLITLYFISKFKEEIFINYSDYFYSGNNALIYQYKLDSISRKNNFDEWVLYFLKLTSLILEERIDKNKKAI